jgi:hypothetical protein
VDLVAVRARERAGAFRSAVLGTTMIVGVVVVTGRVATVRLAGTMTPGAMAQLATATAAGAGVVRARVPAAARELKP